MQKSISDHRNPEKFKIILSHSYSKNMYYSLILSYLNYGILAWGYKSEKIVKIQKSHKDCGQFTI